MICGTFGTHDMHLHYVDQVIGRRPEFGGYAAMNVLMLPGRQLALVDTHVNLDPERRASRRDHDHRGGADERLGSVP